jgi:ADP-ribose pyrophosphatase
VLEHPGSAVVVALDDDGRVFCLRQYRHAARRRFVELPAGLCDVDGEDPLAVARRELREEAGLEAGEWVRLATTYPSPGISAEVMHFFLARDLAVADRGDFVAQHEEADMEAFWVDFDDLRAAALDGRLQDAPMVLGLLLVAAQGYAGTGAAGE